MKRTMEWLALAAILVCAGPAQAASCPDRGTVMAYTLGTIMAYTPDGQGSSRDASTRQGRRSTPLP